MDAKVGDWVVTPRRGKAVEINALWYNALRLLADWLREAQDPGAEELAAHADKTRASFNRRFWYAAGGYLYDVVDGEDGDDPACRPNQLFAISLEHPVLDRERWEAVVTAVHAKLLTPVGLRSLAPGEPDYKPRYFGDLRARDAAYHQGTVWAWLIGPFIDAWLKVSPRRSRDGAAFPRRLRAAPRRSWHRHDQRDLRRRATVHAARLHRPGLERRGGAALFGKNCRRAGIKIRPVANLQSGKLAGVTTYQVPEFAIRVWLR